MSRQETFEALFLIILSMLIGIAAAMVFGSKIIVVPVAMLLVLTTLYSQDKE